MKKKQLKTRSSLLPNRHVQDFFVCDILDASPKADMASMEHPIFSISTKPDKRIRRYESGNGKNFLEVTPSVKGLASVHDRDILIFCISQCIAAKNKGESVSKALRFKAYDFLIATNRPTGGESYKRLYDSLERLSGTRITTNISTGKKEITRGFGLIESFEIVRQTREGKMQEVEIILSDWVFNAIDANEILTIHKDYFRLRKPLERRLYEIARKHCGKQAFWKINLPLLQKKCGSSSTLKEFRRLVGAIVKENKEHNYMPDYTIDINEDIIEFKSLNSIPSFFKDSDFVEKIYLDTETYHDAQMVAPGWDIYFLEKEWKDWMRTISDTAPKNPDAAFIGFCKKIYETRGDP